MKDLNEIVIDASFLVGEIDKVEYIESENDDFIQCVITMKNGHMFIDDCEKDDLEDFTIEKAKKIAYAKAFNRSFGLYEFWLQQQKYFQQNGGK